MIYGLISRFRPTKYFDKGSSSDKCDSSERKKRKKGEKQMRGKKRRWIRRRAERKKSERRRIVDRLRSCKIFQYALANRKQAYHFHIYSTVEPHPINSNIQHLCLEACCMELKMRKEISCQTPKEELNYYLLWVRRTKVPIMKESALKALFNRKLSTIQTPSEGNRNV